MKLALTHHFLRVKKTKVKLTQGGYTLVELLVYMALLSIFVAMTSEIFLSILETKVESIATAGVDQDSKFITNRLTYDIAKASSITAPATLGGNGSSLVFVSNGVTYTYSVNGGSLQVSSVNGTYKLSSNATEVTSVDFKRVGNVGGKDTVRVQMTIQSLAQRRSGKEVKTITTTVGRR